MQCRAGDVHWRIFGLLLVIETTGVHAASWGGGELPGLSLEAPTFGSGTEEAEAEQTGIAERQEEAKERSGQPSETPWGQPGESVTTRLSVTAAGALQPSQLE